MGLLEGLECRGGFTHGGVVGLSGGLIEELETVGAGLDVPAARVLAEHFELRLHAVEEIELGLLDRGEAAQSGFGEGAGGLGGELGCVDFLLGERVGVEIVGSTDHGEDVGLGFDELGDLG